tara:strand:- start:385 stop:1293 length:909 start_codon:yes stop_codon:yes gene_type:complete
MSNYIKKLEADYEEGKITKDEFINSTLDYYKSWDTAKYEKLKNIKNKDFDKFQLKNKIPSKTTASYSINLFEGITYNGYGFWSYPKNKPGTPFLIGIMYLLWLPIVGGILFLSSYPAFILRDFLYKRDFFEDTGFASIMFSLVAIYLPIYLLVKVVDKMKKENEKKRRRKELLITQKAKEQRENAIKFIKEKYKIISYDVYSDRRFEYILTNIDYENEQKMKEFLIKQSYSSIYKPKTKGKFKKKLTTNIESLKTETKISDLSRNEIIKRLKENKELYNDGILTKEEYEKENSKLKNLLIGN